MRLTGPQATVGLLLFLTAGCGADSSGPGAGPTPDTPSEGLWTASGAPSAVLRLSPDQLLNSGNPIPATTITTPSANLGEPGGIAFDTDGTMWLASSTDQVLIALAPSSVATTGSVTAKTVIRSNGTSLAEPAGIAFDRDHNLWVSNPGRGTVVRFDRAQLAASGAPVPTVVLSGLGLPFGLAFDASGALWVTDPNASTIVKFTPEQLAVSGSPTPAVVLTANDHSLQHPGFPAFDEAGNLWVPNFANGTIVAFAPAQLAASGSPGPPIALSTNVLFQAPVAVAFDADGSMWVVNFGIAMLVKFDRAALAASGHPAPSVSIGFTNQLVLGLAFWPKPAGLPLN